jgi:hypothetical protein
MSYQIYELDINEPSHIIYKKKINNNNKEIEPLLELYKGKLYSFIIKTFVNDSIDNFGYDIFSIKKSYFRTLTNLLSSWILYLYIDYDYSSDYFFPTNYNDTSSIENTLRDFCKYDSNIINIDYKINKVVTNLKKCYKNQLNLLEEYSKSDLYKNTKYKYHINKKIVTIKNLNYWKFNIKIPFNLKDKKLNNILDNILLPVQEYNKLINNYNGPKNKEDDIIWCIIFRYQLLSSNNHQLGVLPNIMKKMNTDFNLNFECYASSINSTFTNYCSIYWDLEKYFGSIGSFNSLIPIKGTFGVNPPYQKEIIENCLKKILNILETSDNNLTFIITIPIWDNYGKEIMKNKFNNELKKQNINYGDFNIVNELRESRFFKKVKMIPKEEFTYIDHNFNLYKNKTIQNTYIFIISNDNYDFDKLDKYDFNKI